jgi:phosphatidate phosphatase APP1
MDWQRVVSRIATEVEDRVDRLKDEVGARLNDDRPARVVPYRGYGTPRQVRVRGRVLYGEPLAPATPHDRWWVNLVNTYRRLETDEVAGARVRMRFRAAQGQAVADEEGHFDAEISLDAPVADDRYWHNARIELEAPEGMGATAMVAIPGQARFGVISDLDDTVLRTDARDLIRVAREVLFGNVHTRIPFPGVGAFYRALHENPDGTLNPLFYVSSSPWNLYDILDEFLRLHHIPAGPLELRDWGLSSAELLPTGHEAHKREAIERILATYPGLPFLLVGDSGQEDPEIYRAVTHDHPDRILGVYIRNVHPDPGRIRAVQALAEELRRDGVPLLLVDDTVEAARDAVERGWITEDAVPEVREARQEERAPERPPG